MVESTALEMRRTGNRTVGSNPTLSANYPPIMPSCGPRFSVRADFFRTIASNPAQRRSFSQTDSGAPRFTCFDPRETGRETYFQRRDVLAGGPARQFQVCVSLSGK